MTTCNDLLNNSSKYTLHLGDCRTVLATLDDASIDAIVCDPPYELGFMGKAWDNTGIAYDVTVWQQCLRVLKPGGHLVAFGGSRTYHRLAVAIEDAGFEIRDQIQWIYGSGFPKSLDVSKALDKVTGKQGTGFVIAGHDGRNADMKQDLSFRSDYGYKYAPATDLAKQWQGWGTALKPAHEPAVLARKPLIGTVADNVTAWGVGALNIDGTRIATDDNLGGGSYGGVFSGSRDEHGNLPKAIGSGDKGRWPANVILDEEAAQILDGQSGHSDGKRKNNAITQNAYSTFSSPSTTTRHPDSGGASRFFYTVPNEYNCCLCYNTCAKDMTTEEICKHILVSNAANHGWTIQETNEFTVHVNALLTQNAQLALNVKSAIPQCALCATSIAVALAEIKTLGFNQQKCELILAYMPKFASSILIQNLVSFAELWGNTDTIPTTQNLLMLYGSALHAIENYIKQESKARVGGDNDQVQATRFLYNAKASKSEREAGLYYEEWQSAGVAGWNSESMEYRIENGVPTNPKAPPSQRANHHPTVKPLSLMRYLVRLVTPKGGKVLDPFMGSGSTGCAAVLEGCDFVGIDITPEYMAIAQKRIAHYAVESPLMNL